MKKITCIAIDDEPLALLVIEQFCKRMGGLELQIFDNPEVGFERVRQLRPQIVFLDIEMEGMNGIDIARRLPEDCCLIFTTAHAQYALDGFELNAVDFLHKPFSYERFERAVQKSLVLLEKTCEKFIRVKQEYNNINIPLDKILYVETMENYIRIFLVDGDCVTSRMSLKTLQEMLPPQDFIRIHRCFLVAKNKITSFSRKEVYLSSKNKVSLPIGRLYANEVLRELALHKGKE
jgi:two-component system response regulator LytT